MTRVSVWGAMFLLWLVAFSYLLRADVAEDEAARATAAATQEVDGLYFDLDEGVKVEKGGGGSVYVKSNREYMKMKFDSIEKRFQDLEARLAKIESLHAEALLADKSHKPDRKTVSAGRVLAA